jgi:hypothetical protein
MSSKVFVFDSASLVRVQQLTQGMQLQMSARYPHVGQYNFEVIKRNNICTVYSHFVVIFLFLRLGHLLVFLVVLVLQPIYTLLIQKLVYGLVVLLKPSADRLKKLVDFDRVQ